MRQANTRPIITGRTGMKYYSNIVSIYWDENRMDTHNS